MNVFLIIVRTFKKAGKTLRIVFMLSKGSYHAVVTADITSSNIPVDGNSILDSGFVPYAVGDPNRHGDGNAVVAGVFQEESTAMKALFGFVFSQSPTIKISVRRTRFSNDDS
jgi:hypothetical protein